MSMNPAVMEAMAQTRMADLRKEAGARSSRSRGRITGEGGSNHPAWVHTGATRPAAARRAIGWFLVSVGLRLALRQPRTVSAA